MRQGMPVVALALLVSVVVAIPVSADCYTCAISSYGTPYCKTKASGGSECYARMSPWFCQIYGECGGYVAEPEEKMAATCPTVRWVLTSVELPRTEPQERLALIAAHVQQSEERSTQ